MLLSSRANHIELTSLVVKVSTGLVRSIGTPCKMFMDKDERIKLRTPFWKMKVNVLVTIKTLFIFQNAVFGW